MMLQPPSRLAWRRPSFIANSLAVVLLAWLAWKTLDWAIMSAAPPWATADACRNIQKSQGACWPFLAAKFRLVLFGRYPYEEQWRAALFVALAGAMIVWTLWQALRVRRTGRGARSIAMAWIVGLPCWALLLVGGVAGIPAVSLDNVDGLPLTLLLASMAAFGAFWLSLPLALARRSELPGIAGLATLYIEFVRGVPLVAFLFMAFALTPILLPSGWVPPAPVRALCVLVFFLAAYMAEIVRGAMQNISTGQYEAASTIGLGYWKTMRLVVLPQALRQALPSLANSFISAIKDTAVVFTVGMFDMLGAAESAISDPSWGGRFLEIYVFVGSFYVLMCGGVSLYSRHLERVGNKQSGATR